MIDRTITIIIPALNEEENIQGSIDASVKASSKVFDDYEIIVINDGSVDNTAELVKRNIAVNPKIKLVSHASPQNIGVCFREGKDLALMKYCVLVSGDNPCGEETLSHFFSHAGEADFICGYWANPQIRSRARRILSFLYTSTLNCLLGFHMRYYNGLQIHSTLWLKKQDLKASGFGFYAELIVRAIGAGKTFREVAIEYRERPQGGATKAFRLRNIISVFTTCLHLFQIRYCRQRFDREGERNV